MYHNRIIPALLLKGKGLVKTVKFKKPKYIGDPINAVKIFNDLSADELMFLDITATTENRTIDVGLVKDIGDEAYMPFSVGGGINSSNQIKQLLNAGAEKVVINNSALINPDFITEASQKFGSSTIVVSIDVKKMLNGKYRILAKNGKIKTKYQPVDFAHLMETKGAGELVINSISNDGAMQGYDLHLMKEVCSGLSIPVVALGGAGKLHDIRNLFDNTHTNAAAAGSLFIFHGPRRAVLINYPNREEKNQLFYRNEYE